MLTAWNRTLPEAIRPVDETLVPASDLDFMGTLNAQERLSESVTRVALAVSYRCPRILYSKDPLSRLLHAHPHSLAKFRTFTRKLQWP